MACGKPNKVTFKDKSTTLTDCGDETTNSASNCSDCRFTFTANNPTLVWVIIHPLNCYPSITILDSVGEEIEAGKKYISPSRIEIHFSTPQIGVVQLN
jgi:hypothetical protein